MHDLIHVNLECMYVVLDKCICQMHVSENSYSTVNKSGKRKINVLGNATNAMMLAWISVCLKLNLT